MRIIVETTIILLLLSGSACSTASEKENHYINSDELAKRYTEFLDDGIKFHIDDGYISIPLKRNKFFFADNQKLFNLVYIDLGYNQEYESYRDFLKDLFNGVNIPGTLGTYSSRNGKVVKRNPQLIKLANRDFETFLKKYFEEKNQCWIIRKEYRKIDYQLAEILFYRGYYVYVNECFIDNNIRIVITQEPNRIPLLP
ncbi:MAG: hypothetical protein IK045_02420 [Bacteroidales bacterium]|nr:hypothetical protein [Bacteroidales bacterium]